METSRQDSNFKFYDFNFFIENATAQDTISMKAKINFYATEVGEHQNVLKFLGSVEDEHCMYGIEIPVYLGRVTFPYLSPWYLCTPGQAS